MKASGTLALLEGESKAKAEQLMNEEQQKIYQEFIAAKAYQVFAIKRRDSKNITSTLKESRPMLEISIKDLDSDCFALCTPNATYDLRKGMNGARKHSPEDFITKITSVSPSGFLRFRPSKKPRWDECRLQGFSTETSALRARLRKALAVACVSVASRAHLCG